MTILQTLRHDNEVFLPGDEGRFLTAIDGDKSMLAKLTERGLITFENPGILSEDVDATDGAKALAKELGIDLSDVTGTGAQGRITKPDVEAHAE